MQCTAKAIQKRAARKWTREVGVTGCRMWLRGRISLAMIACVLSIQCPVWATPVNDAPKRPDWCVKGYQCLKNEEVSAATERLIDLQEQIARLKIRSRHFGCVGGVGLGISGVVTDKYDAKAVPAGHAGITCGWVF